MCGIYPAALLLPRETAGPLGGSGVAEHIAEDGIPRHPLFCHSSLSADGQSCPTCQCYHPPLVSKVSGGERQTLICKAQTQTSFPPDFLQLKSLVVSINETYDKELTF